jgi:RNAse (barnase) inhibitor barstar
VATVKIREASDASEQEIFQQIAKKLKFPDYFGNNFAALEDCLGDMTESTRVDIVRYRDDPGSEAARVLWDPLCTVVARVALENPNVHLTMYEK